jgi:hypothetical protein
MFIMPTRHTADTMDVDSGNAKSQGVPAVSLVNRFCIPVVQDTYPVNACVYCDIYQLMYDSNTDVDDAM